MFENILRKLENYCAYRDRSELEVYNKALEYGCLPPNAHKAIELLKENGFLNQDRYLRSFIIGKFRNNGWGKNKIKQYLRRQKIKDSEIEEIFQDEISISEYKKMLDKLCKSKWDSLKKEDDLVKKKQKTARFLISRGFEPNLAFQSISHLGKE